MEQVIGEHLSRQKFLTFQKVRQTSIPVVVKRDGIYLFSQLFYQNYKDWRGQGILTGNRREGIWIFYHGNGQKMARGRLINGEREDLWEFWYPDGQMKSRSRWIDGEPEGLWENCNESGHS